MKRPRSLRFHMLLVLACVLLIIIVLGRLLYAYFENQYRQKLLEINTGAVQQLTETIGQQYASAIDTIDSFSQNATLRQFLGAEDPYERVRIYALLDNLLMNYKKINSGLTSIVLRRSDGEIYSDASTPSMNISITRGAFEALDGGVPSTLLIVNGKSYVAVKRPVYHTSIIRKKTGDCMFIIESEILTNYVETTPQLSGAYYVLDAVGRIIASNQTGCAGNLIPVTYKAYWAPATENPFSVVDRRFIAVSQRVASAGWIVLCLTPQQVAFDELRPISNWTLLLLSAMVVLVTVVYLFMTRSISRSIDRFLQHMDRVAEGKAVRPLLLDSSAEFYRLSGGFNTMMDKLRELNEHNLLYQRKILLQELENKQAQLLALQSQINPHFLYNTLECINSAGAMCGSKEVEEMSTSLAYIFRYAITGSNIVSLRDEVETTRYYLRIQQIRFPGRFSVRYNIPQELLDQRILKFVLQPVVENCVSHGIKNAAGPCVIQVTVSQNASELLLEIEDNGIGMSEQMLREVRCRLGQPSSESGIGLANIQKRIQLYYKPCYGIEINSAPGKGTIVRLILPILPDDWEEEAFREEEDVPSHYSR